MHPIDPDPDPDPEVPACRSILQAGTWEQGSI